MAGPHVPEALKALRASIHSPGVLPPGDASPPVMHSLFSGESFRRPLFACLLGSGTAESTLPNPRRLARIRQSFVWRFGSTGRYCRAHRAHVVGPGGDHV